MKGLVKDATVGQTEQAVEIARGIGRSVLNLGGRKSLWQWLRQVEPRNALFLLKALRRTQRMMEPRHYLAEYDLGTPSESIAGTMPPVGLLAQGDTP